MQIVFMLTQVLPVVCHSAVKGYNEKVRLHFRTTVGYKASSEGDRARDK